MQMWWPLGLLLLSNVAYNFFAKKLPANIDPIASMTGIYALATILSLIMYFVLNKGNTNLIGEYKKFNMVVPLIALCVVGMEAGTLFLYKVGWPLSVGMLINNALVSVCLVVIGVLVFGETVTLANVSGIVLVLVGLFLINK